MRPRILCTHPLSIPSILMTVLAGPLLVATPHPAGAQGFTVGPRVDLPISDAARGVAIGDVNGDGKLDLLTANYPTRSISVLLGNGTGGFSPKSDVVLPQTPGGQLVLALGDVNGDGRLDLAIANSTGGASVLLGDGAGGFGARFDYPTSGGCVDVRIADMTGDGRPDLVIVIQVGDQVVILPGNGAGGFGAMQSETVMSIPSCVAIGDLNGDALPDLCVMSAVTFIASVLVTDGAGGYLPRTDYALPSGASWVDVGDVNRDGKLDMVTCSLEGYVSVFLGDGTGAFGARSDFSAASGACRVVIADMNGDALADVAIAVSGSIPTAGVMLGNGNGYFVFGAFLTLIPNATPSGLAVGDLNGDGRPDLAVVTQNLPLATVLLNSTGGSSRVRADVTVGATPRAVTMGDVNGDGRPDLVVANAGSNTVSVLPGAAAGGFGPKLDLVVGAAPAGVAIGDVNSDGYADLVVANSGAGTISLVRGLPAGTFAPRIDYPTGGGPVSVALADFSGDGRPDAAVVNNISGTLSVLFATGSGLGGKVDYATGANPASVAAGDLNADGLVDLVFSNGSSASASVLLGIGGGAFGARTDFTTGNTPLGVALGDVNGDGKLDLAVASSGSNKVSILTGLGAGDFSGKVDILSSATPSAVALGDVNGDGRLDLSVAKAGNASIAVHFGNGAGGFSVPSALPTAGGSESVAIGDLNGDGRLDLAASVNAAGVVSVLLGLVPTQTALSVSASPLVAGGLMLLNANVSVPAPGFGTPADSVRFFDGNRLLGTSPVLGGAAGLALFAPYLGDRAITAVYKGDGKMFGSISNVVKSRVVATAAAAITDIADIAGDQGRQARLTFTRSPYDYVGSGIPITGYQVYRRAIIAGALKAPLPELQAGTDPNAVQLAGWDYLLTVPATTDDVYQAVVSTLADSNGTGVHRAVLFVRAATATPGVYYDSPADSGHSVDNLAPAMPSALLAVYQSGATHLHWAPNAEDDLAMYRVYRGPNAGFIPSPGTLVSSPPDTGYADAGPPGSWYKVSAVDGNGNQSVFAIVGPGETVDVPPTTGTVAFALERVFPNPAPASRLVVSFSLPTDAPARLEVFDVRGGRVSAQDVGGHAAGRHTVPLSAGRLASGVYLVKLSQGATSGTQRVTVVE